MLALLVAFSSPQIDPSVADLVRRRVGGADRPGVAVAIQQGDQTQFFEYGQADLDAKRPVRRGDIFRIGSITKSITSTALLRLSERGKVRLDAPIKQYLPKLSATFNGVTVRQLLSHTGGVPNYTESPKFLSLTTKPGSSAEIVRLADAMKRPFAPGKGWAYSNTGFFILGDLLEAVAKRPWAEVLNAEIFAPLGMRSTRAIRGFAPSAELPVGYSSNKSKAPKLHYVWPGAAGAIESTTEDLLRFVNGVPKRLQPASLTAAWSGVRVPGRPRATYGLGWVVSERSGQKIVGHGGGIFGFSSSVISIPARKIAVVVLANNDDFDSDGLARSLLLRIVPELREVTEPVSDPKPEVSEHMRQLLEGVFERGVLPASEMTPQLAARVSPPMVLQIQGLIKGKKRERFDLIKAERRDGLEIRIFRVTHGDIDMRVTMAQQPDRKLAGISFTPFMSE